LETLTFLAFEIRHIYLKEKERKKLNVQNAKQNERV